MILVRLSPFFDGSNRQVLLPTLNGMSSISSLRLSGNQEMKTKTCTHGCALEKKQL
jgi:hypothetical protein